MKPIENRTPKEPQRKIPKTPEVKAIIPALKISTAQEPKLSRSSDRTDCRTICTVTHSIQATMADSASTIAAVYSHSCIFEKCSREKRHKETDGHRHSVYNTRSKVSPTSTPCLHQLKAQACDALIISQVDIAVCHFASWEISYSISALPQKLHRGIQLCVIILSAEAPAGDTSALTSCSSSFCRCGKFPRDVALQAYPLIQ